MDLHNKHIVITGGGSGIGKAMAERFAQEQPASITLADVNMAGAEAVAASINGRAVACNVADEQDIIRLIEDTEANAGPIDLFCSNAGIGIAPALESPNQEWQTIWDVNVMAHMFAARHLIPRMVQRGGGYLLNTSSAAGLLNQIGGAAYATTKHAAVGLGEWLSLTYAHQGIKVSMLCPQAVRTPMTTSTEVMSDKSIAAAAHDGMMEPEVLAEAVVQGLRDERFLILPHPQVEEYMRRKTADYDRWLKGMNRWHQSLAEG